MARTTETATSSRRSAAWVVAALLPLPTLVLAAALLGDPSLPELSRPVPPTTSIAAPRAVAPERLLDLYEASRRSTWLVQFAFTRRLGNGGRLDLEVVEVNRPPDRLVVGLGGRSGVVAGRRVACEEVDGAEVCAPTGAAVAFEEELSAQVGELRDVLVAPFRWYEVTQAPDRTIAGERARCLALRRVVAVPSPPYGERAEYCFAGGGVGGDGAVPVFTRIERREGVDERRAVSVDRDVTDAEIADLLGSDLAP